jgi:hypothetical protein
MRGGRALLGFWLALAGGPTLAQGIVTSPRPDRVAVTVYRDPYRAADAAPNLQWLNGYALISETRQVAIPAGTNEIRFEGVAGGILPQSAIVTGLPEGMIERNRDAYLLSPGTLLDRSLGRRVHLRRTSRATGQVIEQEAIVRSGADGALVLQTEKGFEALRCTGLAETPTYDSVPAGLSARPTLSVRARAAQAVTATVTLSYLATGFDWQANYVANLSADGSHVELFAWLTLASMDETGFADADTQAVAGRLNRQDARAQPSEGGPLTLHCWPQGSTSDIAQPEEPAALEVARGFDDGSIVVTGSRIRQPNLSSTTPVTVVMAQQEALGDLKLYRIPEPVTVAARSQKQVALLQQPDVRVRTVYRQWIDPTDPDSAEPTRRVLLTRNRTQEGLGLPLPAGRVQLFSALAGRPILLGEGSVEDRAVGEDVEIESGEAPGVVGRIEEERTDGNRRDFRLTVTNDSAAAISYEAEFTIEEDMTFHPRARLGRRNGEPIWAVTIPANGSATLRYRVVERDG